jgi:hypothetical protein
MLGQVRGSMNSSHLTQRVGAVAALGAIWEVFSLFSARPSRLRGKTRPLVTRASGPVRRGPARTGRRAVHGEVRMNARVRSPRALDPPPVRRADGASGLTASAVRPV